MRYLLLYCSCFETFQPSWWLFLNFSLLLPYPRLPHVWEDRGSHSCLILSLPSLFFYLWTGQKWQSTQWPPVILGDTPGGWGPPSSGFRCALDGDGLPASQCFFREWLALLSAKWGCFPGWNNRGPPLLLRALLAMGQPAGLGASQFGHEGCCNSLFGTLSPGKQSCVARFLHSLVAHHQVTHKFNVIWVFLTDESHGKNTKELIKPSQDSYCLDFILIFFFLFTGHLSHNLYRRQ